MIEQHGHLSLVDAVIRYDIASARLGDVHEPVLGMDSISISGCISAGSVFQDKAILRLDDLPAHRDERDQPHSYEERLHGKIMYPIAESA